MYQFPKAKIDLIYTKDTINVMWQTSGRKDDTENISIQIHMLLVWIDETMIVKALFLPISRDAISFALGLAWKI